MRSLSVPIAGPTRTCNASGCRLFAGATISMASPTSTEPVTLKATTRPAMLELVTYEPPSWAQQLQSKPTHFYNLGQLPTIIHRWKLPGLPSGTEVWIKRDDLSGMQLSGNKVRKLEFLMADAKAQGADCVITLGGIQSNHCRATAVAARYLDLDSYLILRTSKSLLQEDPGLAGNLLVERLVGANIELVSKEEYTLLGSVALGELLAERLKASGRKPYVIPVGGSNSLGTWGYIQAVKEIEDQLKSGEAGGAAYFDDFVMACGSGGTTAGMSLAVHLASLKTKVHAYSVCDDPNYFYEYIQGLLDGLDSGVKSPDIVRISDAKGIGYGFSTAEELETVKRIAEATGIILDPVYSGKAVNAMLRDMEKNPSAWEGRKVLFWHTGGLLGLYDKIHQLQPMIGKWQRLLPEDTVA